MTAIFSSSAALAVDPGAAGLPDDRLVVGFALLLVVAVGLLQLSLGDVVGDEANLPSSVNLINQSRKKRSSFIKGRKN